MGDSTPDFTDGQVKAVQNLVNARYGEEIELHLADSEVQIDPKKALLNTCPIIFWSARECNFVLMRTAGNQYRAQFFYNPHDQFSTQQAIFNDVEDCASAVLREQSDYEREAEGVKSGATGAEID